MKKKRKSSRREIKENSVLDDYGLEPPKRYRNNPSRSSGKEKIAADKKNISRNERRYKETKKRKNKNRLRKVFLWIAVIITLAAMGIILSFTVFFHIENVTVKGNGRYSSEEIITQSNIEKGKNLLLTDIDGAMESIERNLPYVYEAKIKRKLPTTIEITVTEAAAAYSIENKSKTYILLDDNFKVLETDSKKAYGMRILNAEVGEAVVGTQIKLKSDDIQGCLKIISDLIRDKSFTEFTAMYSNGKNENYLVYNERIEFKLGNVNNLEDKIYKGLAACEKLNETNPNAKGIMTLNGDKEIYFTEKE